MPLSEPSAFHRRLLVAGAAFLVAGIAALPACAYLAPGVSKAVTEAPGRDHGTRPRDRRGAAAVGAAHRRFPGADRGRPGARRDTLTGALQREPERATGFVGPFRCY